MKHEKSETPSQHRGMIIYREGVFQRLHLCEYLRELMKGQAEEAVKKETAAFVPEIDQAP